MFFILATALAFVDPMIGTVGTGSEYGGMTPMTGVPFGSMHIIPATRTNAVGRTWFNALDEKVFGFVISRQPAIWMGEFGPVLIPLAQPLKIEKIDAHPWMSEVKAGGFTYALAASSHSVAIETDDPRLGEALASEGVTTARTCRVSMKSMKHFGCYWKKIERPLGKGRRRVAVGVSLVSAANAEAEARAALEGGVSLLSSSAHRLWHEYFSRIKIEAADDVKKIFYTGLYHSLLYPRKLSERCGTYYSAVDDSFRKGPGYSCFSLWDTYRSEHPLLTILVPDRVDEMMQSLVDMYRYGGWLPIWPNPGYTGVMIGDPAAVVLAEAYVKGFRGFDAEAAFRAVLKNADVPQADDMKRDWDDNGGDIPGCPETRGGLTWYLSHGYVAHDQTRESVSRTLDYSLADFSVAAFAAALGKESEKKRFLSRAANFTNLWNASEGAFLPRNRDGSWVDPDKLNWNTRAYVETNKRSARWCVPHDVERLVSLMGGEAAFERELDYFFEKEFYRTDTVGNLSVHGNETCHHVAYLYNRIGKYDKTCRRVRDILRRCYSSSRRGFDGNEDCGAMSAWYILSALGFYPLNPASGEYEIGAPLVDSADIKVAGGVLNITVEKKSKDAWRTVSVKLNGRELSSRRISHSQLVSGGTLHFVLD